MKPIHLGITITTVIGIGTTIGVFVMMTGMFGGNVPSGNSGGYIEIVPQGIAKTYAVGQTINFSVLIQGFGKYPCLPPKVTIYNDNDKEQPILSYIAQDVTCPDPSEHYLLYFPAQNRTFSTEIDQTGNYTLDVSIGKDSYQKQFSVNPIEQNSKFYTLLQIDDLNQTYHTNEPVDFTIWMRGYGVFLAGLRPTVAIENSTGQQVWSVDPNRLLTGYPTGLSELNWNVTAVEIGGPQVIDKTGLYKLVAVYGKAIAEKDFSVTESGPIPSSFSHSGIIPVMADRNYTGFSLKYTITDGPYNKVLGVQDERDKALWLSLKTTRNGILTIDIPRALLDAQSHNQDTKFIILTDGYEVQYNETTSITKRSLTIPFKAGINTIEITVPQLV